MNLMMNLTSLLYFTVLQMIVQHSKYQQKCVHFLNSIAFPKGYICLGACIATYVWHKGVATVLISSCRRTKISQLHKTTHFFLFFWGLASVSKLYL